MTTKTTTHLTAPHPSYTTRLLTTTTRLVPLDRTGWTSALVLIGVIVTVLLIRAVTANNGALSTESIPDEPARVIIYATEVPTATPVPTMTLVPTETPAPTAEPTPQPTAAPQVIVIKEPVYLPAPTVCASVNGGGVSVQKCGYDVDALDNAARAEWQERMK